MNANIKRYILAALAVTVAVAAFVTVVFVVLSPARVRISVIHADSHRFGNASVKISLVVAANNTSRRAAVTYQSLFVQMSNNNTGPEFLFGIRADVATVLPLHQRCSSVANISATVLLGGGPSWYVEEDPFVMAFLSGGGNFTVNVSASARFKVGIARTRLYDIKVFCRPISFFPRGNAAPAALGLPVQCV